MSFVPDAEESTEELTNGSDKPLIDIKLDDITVDLKPLIFPAVLILAIILLFSRKKRRR